MSDDHLWLEHVGHRSFYGFLAGERGELFRDEDFAELYGLTNGRPSVSPSLLATALLQQVHERCSDEEARQRACFDVRWKVALGLEMETRPFANDAAAVSGAADPAPTDEAALRAELGDG